MKPSAGASAALPLLAAALAIGAVATTGFSQASPLPPEIGARFYGFFLDRYPLFAFALVYGLVWIAMLAMRGGTSLVRRILGVLVGASLLLGLGLHPTFGGLVLRAGFATGGMTFLTFQPMSAAYATGAAASAFVFGAALAVSRLLIGASTPAASWRQRIARGLYRCGTGFLALWFAFAMIGAAHLAGFGPWPRRAMSVSEAGKAVSLIFAGFFPHVMLVWLALRYKPRQASFAA
ncbi:hypothetical protein [Methylobacterium marchantiae]|uniref:DUF2306 domain-containing protein n=1 Tax=Methylobacterium marchantiae TaxID=600331 RepID=A0ABW3X329_9HYPH|nr:hypothetical protein AIGOOFII_3854 [Methylobacterium marchantiae]